MKIQWYIKTALKIVTYLRTIAKTDIWTSIQFDREFLRNKHRYIQQRRKTQDKFQQNKEPA